jgi:hypothetical protein
MNCYGPIRPEWNEAIQGLLQEIDRVQDFLSEGCLASASLLDAETKKRMEDVQWIINLSRRLKELEVELKISGGGWIRKALGQTQALIWEISGTN